MSTSRRARWMTVLFVLVLLSGCKHSTEKLGTDTKTYEVTGVVVDKDISTGEVTLKQDAIPGYMEAMTMTYPMMFQGELPRLQAGDVIRARLVMQKGHNGEYTNSHLDEVAVLAQSRGKVKPAAVYNVPSAGQTVPDFHKLNQDGREINLKQFEGKALLITFIYTRCPLGDFCPRMSKNFASIQSALRNDPSLLAKTQLLSISFDPLYDTPAVLRAYANAYVGTQGFEHWQFAMAPTQSLTAMEHFFNVGVTGQDKTLTHSLSTVLIDPDGKVAAWYPGNEWQPNEVVSKMRSLVQPTVQQVPLPPARMDESHKGAV